MYLFSSTLVCGEECAPLSWDFMGVHVVLGFALWGCLLANGIILVFYSSSSNTDRVKEKSGVLQARLHNSVFYCMLLLVFGFLQSAMFAVRTYSRSVDDIEFIVELLACLIYSVDVTISWTRRFLEGLGPGLTFMFTWALMDSFLIPSVICLTITQVAGQRSWCTFSFIGVLHLREAWQRLLRIKQIDLAIMTWRVADVVVNSVALIFFCGMMIMTLENLGDPEALREYNRDRWNTVSSIYFVVVTISTVGYGDLAPASGMGRFFSVITIFGGIASVAMSAQKVALALSVRSRGGGTFEVNTRTRHVVVTGNPTEQMVKDFIAELFHPDHSDDADDLHCVFLFPLGSPTAVKLAAFMKHKSNIKIAPHVHIFQGSALEPADLHRTSALQALAFFVLPNSLCNDVKDEDTENIIRMVAIQRAVPTANIVLVLMKSEHEQLLKDAGVDTAATSNSEASLTLVAMDKFKLELVGKTCAVPGFCTFVCNLCQCVAEDEDIKGKDAKPQWQQEYDTGLGNELYEVDLSGSYAQRGAVFIEVAIDVLEQTGGTVYLIGLVETTPNGKHVLVNPGPSYPIKPSIGGVSTAGIFIASNRDAIVMCEVGSVFLGRRERPKQNTPDVIKNIQESENNKLQEIAVKAESKAQQYIDPRQMLSLNAYQQQRAQQLVGLIRQQARASQPARPPLKLLARGGHVLILASGCEGLEEVKLGLEHFVKPLRTNVNPDNVVPIVILAPVVPRDWHNIADFKDVYLLRGSPLVQFDLDRANFKDASVIFICQIGGSSKNFAESWMVDSEVICVSRVVESQLDPNSKTSVIVELNAEQNHPFLPLRSNTGVSLASSGTRALPSAATAKSGTDLGSSKGTKSKFKLFSGVTNMFKSKANLSSDDEEDDDALGVSPALQTTGPEYYWQPRYASGQLFVGSIVTSLAVNTFYNPTLCKLVSTMIASHVSMLEVKPAWVGKSYFEFFDHLLWSEHVLAVGIFRKYTVKGGSAQKSAYVYTAPPGKETTMFAGDRVICFKVCKEVSERKAREPKGRRAANPTTALARTS